jgi:hypothetical protein
MCGSSTIDAFVQGDINQVIRHRSIKEALRQGLQATASIEINKTMGSTRPKRVWINDDTRPWNIEELI